MEGSGRGDAPRGALREEAGAHPHAHLHRAHLVRDDARGGGGGLGSRRAGCSEGILARVRELLAHVLLRAPGIAARPETLELQTPRPAGDRRARGGLGDVQARLLAKAHAERSPPEHVRVFEEIAHGPHAARRPPGVAHVRVLDVRTRRRSSSDGCVRRRRAGREGKGRGKGAGVNERHAGSATGTDEERHERRDERPPRARRRLAAPPRRRRSPPTRRYGQLARVMAEGARGNVHGPRDQTSRYE